MNGAVDAWVLGRMELEGRTLLIEGKHPEDNAC